MAIIHSRAVMVCNRSGDDPAEDAGNMRLINELAQREFTRDQVYIRSMYLCSSQLCETDWCRFTEAALEQIAEKVVGESVLAGHDKRSLPVARFFKATVVDRPEIPDPETGNPTRWVRAWFYWLKETDGARDLALNMDGGIYREVSISWRYPGGRCSICEQPSHTCPHIPGETTNGDGVSFAWRKSSRFLKDLSSTGERTVKPPLSENTETSGWREEGTISGECSCLKSARFRRNGNDSGRPL